MTDEVELRLEDMEYKLYLIVSPGCPGCLQAEVALEDHIKAGYIKKLNIDDPKAKELCEKLNIMHVPALVIEKDGKCAECELKVGGDDVIIDCPDLDKLEEKKEEQPQEVDIEEEIQRLIKGRGQLVIKCMDPLVKSKLAQILMDQTPDWVRQLLFALPPCEDGKPIDFERVTFKGSKSTSEYLEFMKKCLKEVEGASQAEKMKKCAEMWKERKKKEGR